MMAVSMLVFSALAATNCSSYSALMGCNMDDYCDWNPSVGKCFSVSCSATTNATCIADPMCQWNSQFNMCSENATAVQCSNRSLKRCPGPGVCGVLLGSNTCASCSSAHTRQDCGMRSCYWNGTTCGGYPPQCGVYTNAALCIAHDCIWDHERCRQGDPSTDLCIGGANTTNCVKWKYGLEECSSLGTPNKCAMQATCLWNQISESCEDADLCMQVDQKDCARVNCTSVANGLCSDADAFTKCSSLQTCSTSRTCAKTGSGNCTAIAGCNQLQQTACLAKPTVCQWSNTTNQCHSSGTSCTSLKLQCAGAPCQNLAAIPNLASYEVTNYGSAFYTGQNMLSASADSYLKDMVLVKNGVPCVNCPLCAPGFVLNIVGKVRCGVNGTTGSFDQQVCVAVGDYDDGSSSLALAIIIVIIVGGLVFLALIGGGCKVLRKKGSNDHYSDIQE